MLSGGKLYGNRRLVDVPSASGRREQTMPLRKAEAAWHGTFREGEGMMRLGSGAFEGAYSYRSRMEDSDTGTNPEESRRLAQGGCRRGMVFINPSRGHHRRSLPPAPLPHRKSARTH